MSSQRVIKYPKRDDPETPVCPVFGCSKPPANPLYNDRCADHQKVKKINVNLIIKFK